MAARPGRKIVGGKKPSSKNTTPTSAGKPTGDVLARGQAPALSKIPVPGSRLTEHRLGRKGK